MTPSRIEPATFRFVAQHLNHCATAVPVRPYYTTLLIIRYTADLLQIYRCTDLVLSLNIREMKKCMLCCSYLVTMTFYFARAFCVFAHRYSHTNRKRAKPKRIISNQCYTIIQTWYLRNSCPTFVFGQKPSSTHVGGLAFKIHTHFAELAIWRHLLYNR